MAQTGYTAIQLYYTTTVSATPTAGNLAAGELAINTADEKLYFKNSSGVVKLLASTLMVGTNGGTGVNNGSRTLSYAGNVAFTGAFNPTFAIPSSSTYTFPTGDSTLVSTTGTVAVATAANGLKSSSTTVAVSSATAPSSGQVLTATSSTAAIWQGLLLSNVVAATGPATIANANNAIAWNWAQTTASQSAFTIGETSASTGGSGSQVLCKIGTLAASTADPLQVVTRGVDTIRVSRTGDVTITSTSTAVNGSATGSAITITAGAGATGGGGPISITTGGASGGTATGGAFAVTTGAGSNGASGTVSVTSGNGGAQPSGDVTFGSGTSTNNTGSTTIRTGASSSNSGDINITIGTATSTKGKVNFVNVGVANGSVATTITSLGPAGAATTIQGWLAIKVDGTARYIPFW